MWLHFLIKLSCHLLRPFVILRFPVQPLLNHIGDQKECHCGYFRPNFVVILRRGEVTSLTSYLRPGGGGGGALKGRRGTAAKFEQLFSLIPLTENNRLDF